MGEKEAKDALDKGNFPTQGPSKIFYEITILGAFYFCFMMSFLVSDVNILFNLLEEYSTSEKR